ncbi:MULTISPECIES: polyprenyl synthetase family protein [Acinetobacter]|uniref:Polyprenyl synthetase family protein n=1 Tax=Acinetobacter towneri TaxID=202956 RepID=A0AB35M0S1_9GAMM|nr:MULTISPECIES: farnesyl diphosphate synthase [Acinetobacter]MCA4798311.1 polyprenyl synthetase family protein [Acinetobacter towneri]MCA4814282.1 polyprenyl synthetase family protein [Acinetobacter towneri]MDM1719140.1 polyprenyl synthetase family protein [Acinetobacter towneri]MDM1731289.1 polyprenyl synthetase family protein [Acinetobacter towneri]MDM1733968.1 polyprenyl synthetase family protein [Acinetobacter towneri]
MNQPLEANVSSLHDLQAHALTAAQQRIQQDLLTALEAFALPEPLKSAVHHAVMLGGKRVRPALCYATAALRPNQNSAAVRRAAVAIELIHCYSLAHDDLPCMDNDLLRRGQPTCHAAYGEDTALLAGDILQSMAFEILGSRLFDQAVAVDQGIVLKQMQILATASSKMVCGQVLDLQSEGKQVDQATLENIHRNKTGALISAAVMMAAVTVFDGRDKAIPQLREYAQAIGLAFQVQDDILDIISDTEVLGKTAGKDEQVEKSTYPALMGLEKAQAYAQELHDQAFAALAYFKTDTVLELQQISEFLLSRKS